MMQTLGRLLLPLLLLVLPSMFTQGQEIKINKQKMHKFSMAIAHAEGFGVRRAIPTRYHNPGDVKFNPRNPAIRAKMHLKGVRGVGKGGHTIFKDDAAGWAALHELVTMMLDGRSRVYHKDMTINQVAKKYAGQWRRWSKHVSEELGVPPTTTLAEYFELDEEPPVLTFVSQFTLFSASSPVLPVLVRN